MSPIQQQDKSSGFKMNWLSLFYYFLSSSILEEKGRGGGWKKNSIVILDQIIFYQWTKFIASTCSGKYSAVT